MITDHEADVTAIATDYRKRYLVEKMEQKKKQLDEMLQSLHTLDTSILALSQEIDQLHNDLLKEGI